MLPLLELLLLLHEVLWLRLSCGRTRDKPFCWDAAAASAVRAATRAAIVGADGSAAAAGRTAAAANTAAIVGSAGSDAVVSNAAVAVVVGATVDARAAAKGLKIKNFLSGVREKSGPKGGVL